MTTETRHRTDLDRMRWLLTLAALVLLAIGVLHVLSPFLNTVCWAIILVLSTWRPYRWLAKKLKRRGLAAGIMTLAVAAILLLVLGPLLATIIHEAKSSTAHYREWYLAHREELPALATRIPLIGSRLSEYLGERQLTDQMVVLLGDYQNEIFRLASALARDVLDAVFEFIVCLFTAFFLYRDGAELGAQLRAGLSRVGGERFEHLLEAVRHTVRGSVYGAIITALAQGFFASVGFLICGAPVPLLLGVATLIFSPIPFGAPLVYLPAALAVGLGHSWWYAAGLGLWGVLAVNFIDSILRPYFISQSTRMPLILVFFGIVGGVVEFGVLGIFLGPVLIAVAQELWLEWVEEKILVDEAP
jgi:predicted PurR-regulated permease PerM